VTTPRLELPAQLRPLLGALVALGVAVDVVAIALAPAIGWAGLLVGAVWGISVALGAALLIAVCALTGARWWHPVRGASVEITRTLGVPAALLAVVLLVAVPSLYPWAHPAVGSEPAASAAKAAWLNRPFFIARGLIILMVWLAFAGGLRRLVVAEIERGSTPRALPRLAAAFAVVFAVTISVGFWDWTLSLEPEWYSTMYGVYGFAAVFKAGIAAVLLGGLWCEQQRSQNGRDATSADSPLAASGAVATLGGMLFAFSFFWAYIWYSQGMLIWYANLPEEVVHYQHGLSRGWAALFWLDPVINFVIPFLALLSSAARRSRWVLRHVALLSLAGAFVDLLLLVGPARWDAGGPMPWVALTTTVAVAAGMLLVLVRARIRASKAMPARRASE